MIEDASAESNTATTGQRHIDPADVLPEELVADVFHHLSLAGRLAASRVCALWRRIALADRRLWAQYTIKPRYSRKRTLTDEERSRIIDAAAGALAALLARSDPLAFCLTCLFDAPDSVVNLVVAHMARMESLRVCGFESDGALQRILAQDIPMLKSFNYSRYAPKDTPWLISARWEFAQRLEELHLGCPCIWPPGCAFPALRSFTGLLPDGSAHVSRMFPNVTALDLMDVTQSLLDRLDPLPHSLTALSLHTDRHGIDCAALLGGCTVPHLRQLTVDHMQTTSSVLEIFQLFMRTFNEPWKLRLNGGGSWLTIPGLPACVEYISVCHAVQWHEILPLCYNLRELDLRPGELLQLCATAAVLPALVSVRVLLISKPHYRAVDSLYDTPSIQAPAMQTLTLRTSIYHDFIKPIGASLELILRAFCSPRLACVVLEAKSSDEIFQHETFAALWPRASCVEVRNPQGSVVAVFMLDEPSAGHGMLGRDTDLLAG